MGGEKIILNIKYSKFIWSNIHIQFKVSVHSSGKKGVFHRRNEIAKIQMKETMEKKVLDQVFFYIYIFTY